MPSLTVSERAGTEPVLPVAVDSADIWLLRAAADLVAACRLPDTTLAALAAGDVRPFDLLVRPSTGPSPDAPGLAVLLAATAVESRLNRTVRLRDPDDWHSVAHLAPDEKLGLTPRLLGKAKTVPPEHHELTALAEELFAAKTTLVESEERPEVSVAQARELVHASARICAYLSALGRRPSEAAVAAFVERVAEALAPRARSLSAPHAEEPKPDWSWSRDVDFPPDLVGS